MTKEKILELASYYFEQGENEEWIGTTDGILEFAEGIHDRLLKKLIIQLEGMVIND